MPVQDEIEIPKSSHELLANNHIAILSVFRRSDGAISASPVGYVWDGQRIRVSTLKSRWKYKNLLADPRITLCIVSRFDVTEYIELRGTATIEEDSDRSFWQLQFREGCRILLGKTEEPPDLDAPDAERVIITLRPQKISSPLLYDGRVKKYGQ